jgi:hypothetical protein
VNLSTGRSQLHSARKNLREHWEETRLIWSDPVCEAFENDFLQPLEQQIHATIRATDRLAATLAQLQQDCE